VNRRQGERGEGKITLQHLEGLTVVGDLFEVQHEARGAGKDEGVYDRGLNVFALA